MNNFNQHFESGFLKKDMVFNQNIVNNVSSLNIKFLSQDEITLAMKHIKNKPACGPDLVPS